MKTKNVYKQLIGIILLAIGFWAMEPLSALVPKLGFFSLAITGTLAFYIGLGSDAYKQLFKKPDQFWKNFWKYFVLSVIYAVVAGVLVKMFIHGTVGNPENDDPWVFLILPIALLGEELLSIYVLETANKYVNTVSASVISCIVFGMIHLATYYHDSILITAIQVLILQGGMRWFFNQSYLKTNKSIWTSYAVHLALDYFTFAVPIIVQLFMK